MLELAVLELVALSVSDFETIDYVGVVDCYLFDFRYLLMIPEFHHFFHGRHLFNFLRRSPDSGCVINSMILTLPRTFFGILNWFTELLL